MIAEYKVWKLTWVERHEKLVLVVSAISAIAVIALIIKVMAVCTKF